MFINSKGSND